jgi:hypothetical protein
MVSAWNEVLWLAPNGGRSEGRSEPKNKLGIAWIHKEDFEKKGTTRCKEPVVNQSEMSPIILGTRLLK